MATRQRVAARPTILEIAGDGPPRRGEVHAHLMAEGAARLHLDQREAASPLEHAHPRRTRRRSRRAWRVRDHAPRPARLERERQLDAHLVGQAGSVDDREISLVDPVRAQGIPQRLERQRVARRNHQARGARIEAVDDAGLALPIADAAHLRVARQQRPGERSGLARGERRRRLPRGFVDNDQIVALEPHVESALLARRREAEVERRAHHVTRGEAGRLVRPPAPDRDQAAFDQACGGATAEPRAMAHEEPIEALASVFLLHGETSRAAHQLPTTPRPSGLPAQPSCGASVS